MIVKCRGLALAVSAGLVLLAGAPAAFGSGALTPGSIVVAQAAAPAGKAAAANAGAAKAPAAKGAASRAQADLQALTKAAKAEGEVVFYSAATENIARRVADVFQKKYGIKTSFTRLNSIALQQRYATEAEAGTFAADLVFNAGGSVPFAAMGINRGWVESVSKANLPAITSGEFPERFNRGPTALIQIGPWNLTYHTGKLKGADIPKDWPDVLKPHLKGQILLADPRASDAYLDFFGLLFDKYGEGFFKQLRAQQPRFYSSGVPAVQALGAGEGAITFPAVPGQISATKDKGAPIDMVAMAFTTGVEMQIMLTARDKAKHPNAARLLANWVMTKEGNTVFNDDPGGFTIYDPARIPKEYRAPKITGEVGRKDLIVKLLGVQ